MTNAFVMLLKLLLVLIWIAARVSMIGLIIGLILEIMEIGSVFNRILPSWSLWTYILALVSLSAVEYLIVKVLDSEGSKETLRSPWMD